MENNLTMPQKPKHSYPISLQGVCVHPREWKTSHKISQVNAHGIIILNSKKKKKSENNSNVHQLMNA